MYTVQMTSASSQVPAKRFRTSAGKSSISNNNERTLQDESNQRLLIPNSKISLHHNIMLCTRWKKE